MMSRREGLRKHVNGITFAAILFVSTLTMAFSSQQFVLRPKALGHSIAFVFQQTAGAVGRFFADTVNSIGELSRLREEHEALLARVETYEGLEQDLSQIRAENEQLRNVLGFADRIEYRTIAARIVGKAPGNTFETFTVNKGSAHGVRINQPVVAVTDGAQGLVGRIREVSRRSSMVVPIFDSASYVAARLLEARYDGLVVGDGNESGGLRMLYVENSGVARNSIRVGDSVVTSGLSSIYPPGIDIGRVTSLAAEPYDTSLVINVQPIVDFARIEYVFLLEEGL
jgi:rod shape-determining protein MreC